MLVAEGAADICIEPNPKQWDVEAPGLIVREAGGSTWFSSQPSTPATEPRISIATNGKLGPAVLAALKLDK
jgi:fructose-1,6-bisphosphatase/inositol monophosphatase family enzyme